MQDYTGKTTNPNKGNIRGLLAIVVMMFAALLYTN